MCDFKSIVVPFRFRLVSRRRKILTMKLDQISITEILDGLNKGSFSSEQLIRAR